MTDHREAGAEAPPRNAQESRPANCGASASVAETRARPGSGASLTTGEAAAFRRGAAAMREATAVLIYECYNRIGGALMPGPLVEAIRALPLPEPGA